MSEGPQNLRVEVLDGVIGRITIDRPKVLNALDRDTLGEIDCAFDGLLRHEAVRVIVLAGGGEKAFVAGADIAEMAALNPLQAREFSRRGQAVLARLEQSPKPTIAMIQGYALGGGLELALACHLRVASNKAKLGLPEVTLGLLPGFGGTQRLARLAGAGVAREWILSGDAVGAEEALRVGVLNRVVEPERLWESTRELALKLAARGPLAQKLALEVLRRGLDDGQSAGERAESDAFGLVFASEDMREGTRAFLDKRKAEFRGR